MPQTDTIRTPKETLKHFLSQNGYVAMTPKARTEFLNQNLHVEELRKAVLSNKVLANKVTTSQIAPKLEQARLERQLLGIQRTAQIIEMKQKEEKRDNLERNVRFGGNILDKAKDIFTKATGKDNAGNQISLALLIFVLLMLWSMFATVKTKNGMKTTRIRLFGNVLMGNAGITPSTGSGSVGSTINSTYSNPAIPTWAQGAASIGGYTQGGTWSNPS